MIVKAGEGTEAIVPWRVNMPMIFVKGCGSDGYDYVRSLAASHLELDEYDEYEERSAVPPRPYGACVRSSCLAWTVNANVSGWDTIETVEMAGVMLYLTQVWDL